MDDVLQVIGVKTVEHAEPGAADSLRQWSSVKRSNLTESTTSVTAISPMTDSALGDEVEEGVEAFECIEISEDSVHS